MSDAKISIQAIADDEDLKKLAKSLSEATAKSKELAKALKEEEKAHGTASTKARELRAELIAQKAAVSEGNKKLRSLADTLASTGEKAGGLKDKLQGMIGDKLGINLGDLTSKLTSSTAVMGAMAASAAVVASALASAGREVSAYSNQFITYTKNMKSATEMYNMFNEVARNMNSSYNEQQIYDMAKGFMNVGVSAKEAKELIVECTDAAASLGKGAEQADMLADCFKRLATGGELTEKQYKAIAEAGIDLSDVQEQMRAGGTEAYEALKEKLKEYEGGMASTKNTSAEMEGDIKANFAEIGRQTAILVDDFFGFSDSLHSFYQWVIEVTQACIDSIRSMQAAIRGAKASADAYASTIQSFGEEYDNAVEAAKQGDQEAAKQVALMEQQAHLASEQAKAEEQEAIALEKQNAELAKRPQVQSIAKTSTSGSAGGSGGSASASKKDTEAAKAQREIQRDINKITQDTIKLREQMYGQATKLTSEHNKQAQIGKTGLELEKLKYEQDKALYDEQIKREQELNATKVQALQKEQAAVQEAIDAGTAPDGSQAKIDKLQEQIEAENALSAAKIANIQAEAETRKMAYEDDSALNNTDPMSGLGTDELNGISAALDLIKSKWSAFAKTINVDTPQLKAVINTVGTPFANMAQSIIMGTKSAAEAMQNFVKEMIIQAINMLAEWTTIFAIVSAFQGPVTGARVATKMVLGIDSGTSGASAGISGGISTPSIDRVSHYASGGYIAGPGTSTSDSIPAMLSNGEYVLNASAVDAIGVSTLNAVNSGDVEVAGGAGQSMTFNISAIDATGFADFLTRGGGSVLAQYTKNLNRSFSTDGVW